MVKALGGFPNFRKVTGQPVQRTDTARLDSKRLPGFRKFRRAPKTGLRANLLRGFFLSFPVARSRSSLCAGSQILAPAAFRNMRLVAPQGARRELY
jgi:hypothetical protein